MKRLVKWLVAPAALLTAMLVASPNMAKAGGWSVAFGSGGAWHYGQVGHYGGHHGHGGHLHGHHDGGHGHHHGHGGVTFGYGAVQPYAVYRPYPTYRPAPVYPYGYGGCYSPW